MKNTDHESYYMQLGLNIAKYRRMRHYTQLELAEKTDLSRTHISNIEAANVPTRLSLESIFIISDVLEIEPKLLFEFQDI